MSTEFHLCRICLEDLPSQSFDSEKVGSKDVLKRACRICLRTKQYNETYNTKSLNIGKLNSFDAWMVLDKKRHTPVGNWYYTKQNLAAKAKKEIGNTVIVRRVKINILGK